jgi:hypothetical protein
MHAIYFLQGGRESNEKLSPGKETGKEKDVRKWQIR